jgi:TRAP-type transport system small permease protein
MYASAFLCSTRFVIKIKNNMKKLEHALYVMLGTIAGLALLAMMLLAFVDVTARKFNVPLAGGVELTELLMVVLVFSGLPLVSMRAEHVTFDLIDQFLSNRVRSFLMHSMQFVASAAFFALAWFMWSRANRLLDDGLTTAQLKISIAPFAYVMCAMLAVTAVIHLVLAVSRREKMDDHAQSDAAGTGAAL